jgi:broad specificity phosphatase PhoE
LIGQQVELNQPVTGHKRPALLVLVRHGQSVRNLAKRGNTYFPDADTRDGLRGQPDHLTPLTETGLAQALDAGVLLRTTFGGFDYLYHSGYQRTIQTAEGILSAYQLEERAHTRIRHNLFLREREVGYTFDMTTDEANAAFPWLQEYWETFGRFFARPPGAESLADVAQRVYMFLGMLFRDRADQRVLVVCHGGTMRMFRFWLERWTYEEVVKRWDTEPIPNCGVMTYRYSREDGRLVLVPTVCP